MLLSPLSAPPPRSPQLLPTSPRHGQHRDLDVQPSEVDNSSQINKTAFRTSRHFHVLRKGQLFQSQHQNGDHSRPTWTPARSGLRGLRGPPSQQELGCSRVFLGQWVVCTLLSSAAFAVVSWGLCLYTPLNTTISHPGGLRLFSPLQ